MTNAFPVACRPNARTDTALPASLSIAPSINKHVYLLRLDVRHLLVHEAHHLVIVVHPITPSWTTTQARIVPHATIRTVVIKNTYQFHRRQGRQVQQTFDIHARACSFDALHLDD